MEVFPPYSPHVLVYVRFLHTRGGVSMLESLTSPQARFSPHTWRCFFACPFFQPLERVFSTHVEVFLSVMRVAPLAGSFLHTRGGVSKQAVGDTAVIKFSPHTWRCFLAQEAITAAAGSFLHTRGGVSILLIFQTQSS